MNEYSVTKDGKTTIQVAASREEAKILARAAFDAGAEKVAVLTDDLGRVALFLDAHCAPKWSMWFDANSRG